MSVNEYATRSNMNYDGIEILYMTIHNTTPQTYNRRGSHYGRESDDHIYLMKVNIINIDNICIRHHLSCLHEKACIINY